MAPGNADLDLPSVLGAYVLLDGVTGQVKAQIDGPRLTLRRTACASALAANYLARPDASDLLVVGAGALAPHRIGAFAAVRPIRNVTSRLWYQGLGPSCSKASRKADSARSASMAPMSRLYPK